MGKVYQWRVWAEGDTVNTEYGVVGGQLQTSSVKAEAKNVGKANATTPQMQAFNEAKSLWQHKLDLKYSDTPEVAEEFLLRPMLAKDYFDALKSKKNAPKFPLEVQPKLDGVRALAYWDETGKIEFMSRSGKSYSEIGSLDHIAAALANKLPKGVMLDGEIYAHGSDFQKTTGWIKRKQQDSLKLVYHIYDVIALTGEKETWNKRREKLERVRRALELYPSPALQVVPTLEVMYEREIQNSHELFVSQGYEGLMIRTLDGVYEFGSRSFGLLKFKSFQDADYEIVDVVEGVGKMVGSAIFVCKTPQGKTFNVVPKGSAEARKKMWEEADTYKGAFLKVKYFELTNDLIPRFPIGLGVRLQQDTGGA